MTIYIIILHALYTISVPRTAWLRKNHFEFAAEQLGKTGKCCGTKFQSRQARIFWIKFCSYLLNIENKFWFFFFEPDNYAEPKAKDKLSV